MLAKEPPCSLHHLRQKLTLDSSEALQAFTRPRSRALPKAGIALVAVSAFGCVSTGCVSTTDLEGIQSQIRDVQVHVLELKKESPTGDDLASLERLLDDRLQSLIRAQTDVRTDLDEMTEQIERLQAKLDDTNFRLAQLAQQITATNQELQAARSEAEEARRSRPSPPERRPATGSSDPQALYDTAYNDYVAGNLDLAILGFRQYLDDHAETALADNATYWLGECYYRQGKFRRAVERFDQVLKSFEASDRAASAQLKKAYAQLELGQRDEAVEVLQAVACDFSGTDEALLAKQRLQELGFDAGC